MEAKATKDKIVKLVYKWQRTPMSADKSDKILTKAQIMGYNIVQSGVWESMTTLFAKAHGYSVKELEKLSASKDEHAIYMEGTIEQCQKDLDKLQKGVLKGETTSSIVSKIKNNRLLKRTFGKKNLKVDYKEDKLEDLKNQLLIVGIILEVYIDDGTKS